LSYQSAYLEDALDKAAVEQIAGLYLLEFGANWCGHCQAAQPAIAAALDDFPELPHRKIEDGPGRRLGRSFRVKLWPTLILLKEGQEIARAVRPTNVAEVAQLLSAGA